MALVSEARALAQEEPSRLRYEVPAGWTPSLDGRTLLPPGGNSAVTFAPSMAFAGTDEEWIAHAWDDIARELELLSGPAPGRQGAFLSRIGLFQQANGADVWLCLNSLVRDGRGESVILIASDEARFRAAMPGLSKMLVDARVESSVDAAASPGAPGQSGAPVAGSSDIAGLYLASTPQYRLDPLGGSGSGSMEWRTEFYLLSRDGRVFRGPDLPDAPGGDIHRFDFDAARRVVPQASGTWTPRGHDVVLVIGGSPVETIVATRPSENVLEIRGTKFKRSVK